MISTLLSRSLCLAVLTVPRRSIVASTALFCQSADCVPVVTHLQLKTMLSNRDIQLFDVRNPEEYQAGHIVEAVNIPLGNLEESLKLSPQHFEQKFGVKAPEKDHTNLVFHCRSGTRSSKALEIARQLGFNRARHYKGGYSEWLEREDQLKRSVSLNPRDVNDPTAD